MSLTGGNRTSSSNVYKDFLLYDLGLRQLGTSTIFRKGGFFILSPSVQNEAWWFDVRKVYLDKLNQGEDRGYLLVRLLDRFLLISLEGFFARLVEPERYENTANSGIHWKFRVFKTVEGFKNRNLVNKREMNVAEVDRDYLKVLFNGIA